MSMRIEYREKDQYAVIVWNPSDEDRHWIKLIRRLILEQSEDAIQENAWQVALPWWSFTALRSQLKQVVDGCSLQFGREIKIDERATELLRNSRRISISYEEAREAEPIPEADIRTRLQNIGFVRKLSAEQVRNVACIAALPAAATFSVPGAGKTTEALAYYFLRAQKNEKLLVIAPKNAFAVWDEEIAGCMDNSEMQFIRLRGGRDNIESALDKNPRFMIITYQQLARVPSLIATHCVRWKVHIFLDESHRIKSGVAKQTARAVLSLSHLPVGKLIMSGTPMPQSPDDLIPQFAFLYPEIPATSEDVIQRMHSVFVRTNKKELGLPPVKRVIVTLPMAPMQRELYRLMKSEIAREASTLNIDDRQAFRLLGRTVVRLLQFVSNPALLSAQIGFENPALLAAVLAEGDGPKLKYLLHKVRKLVCEGKKVLIWSSFVRNVEYVAERLIDLGTVYIHGGVDAGDEDDDDTREGKIKRFHSDPSIQVMVANPAAASEGISLHRICHHALYLDRTFNAAHYLQSEDRIHRFGLESSQDTTIEILECLNSVDETVRGRLNYKIDRMAEALEDSSLRTNPIVLDPTDAEDGEDYSAGLDQKDIEALLKGFSKEV